MEQKKPWWQSRTIWSALIGGFVAILSIFGVLPDGLTQNGILEAVMAITSIAAIIFRGKATKAIEPIVKVSDGTT